MGKHSKPEEGKKKVGIVRRIFRFIGCLILIVVLAFAGIIGWLSATEYKPDDVTEVSVEGKASAKVHRKDNLTVMSWNIGYGALGDNADFFMDGGKGVMTADHDRLDENISGIENEIEVEGPDILFLQEVDEDSTRSHHVDELADLRSIFTDYASAFAYNYKVSFVPFPVPPLGKVQSGIATFSKFGLDTAERYQLPCPFKWPIRVANLKRALLVTRVPVEGSSNELVLVNLHLEAYDSGEGKIAQTKQLAQFLNEEYKKGNYVIAGGDFNQIFSSEKKNVYPAQEGKWQPGVIDITGIEGTWSFLMDETVPSCRSLDQPYAGADHESFQYYLIDGFIVSGNIKVNKFANRDLGFENSDHNPVVMEITLK